MRYILKKYRDVEIRDTLVIKKKRNTLVLLAIKQ